MVSAGLRSHPEDNYEISIGDSIKLYNKAKDVFKIIYDEGNYIFYNCRLETCEWELYRLYKKLDNIEESLYYFLKKDYFYTKIV